MFLRRRGAGISWASVSPSQVVWRPLEAIWRRLGVCWAPRWGRQTPYRAGEEGKHAGSPRRQMTMRGTGRRQIWKGVEARGWRTDSMLWQREALAGKGWRRADLGGRRHGGGGEIVVVACLCFVEETNLVLLILVEGDTWMRLAW
jgi:hypothetical protein